MAKLKIMIDAGHGVNTAGKRCLKSLDSKETREWTLNNRDANHLMTVLSGYECDVARADDVTGKVDVSLSERVAKANNWKADVYISLHHDAGLGGRSGGGTTVYYYSSKVERLTQSKELYNCVIEKTGLAGNRSSKVKKHGFYVIKNTSMPAFLIENGFMDSPTDVPVILTEEHSRKTAEGIVNFLVKEFGLKSKPNNNAQKFITIPELKKSYIYAGVDYKLVFDPVYYYNAYADLRKALGKNEDRLLKHFVQYGMKEQRQACAWFNVAAYKNNYADLQKAFGSDMPKYYRHYIQYGYKENRRGY